MTRMLCWSLILGLLGGFVVVATILMRERVAAGRGLPAYSRYSQADDGLGEAAQLLEQLGWTPVSLTTPIQATRLRGLLILDGPLQEGLLAESEAAMTPGDAEALLRWVAQGNTLLLAANTNTPIHQALNVSVTDEAAPEGTFTPVELGAAGAYFDGVDHISVAARATLRQPRGALPLWWIGGKPGALLVRHGKGRLVAVADPGLFTRRGLVRDDGEPRDDNAVFLVNLVAFHARGGEVYFDEYHHGIRGGGGFWSYLAFHGERITLIPLALVVLVAGWAWAVRLGPAVPTTRTHRADAVEYASALGRLYQRSGARRLLARTLVRGFLDALTRHLRLRRQAVPAVVLAAWRQQHARTAAHPGEMDPTTARLQVLLRGVTELRKGDISDRQLLTWTQSFDQFLKLADRGRQTADAPGSPPKQEEALGSQ
jgi:hypothetical protein